MLTALCVAWAMLILILILATSVVTVQSISISISISKPRLQASHSGLKVAPHSHPHPPPLARSVASTRLYSTVPPAANAAGKSMSASTSSSPSSPSTIVSLRVDDSSPRLKKAKLRLAEAQGLIPFGASETPEQFNLDDLSSLPRQASRVKEISWRVAEPAVKYDPEKASQKFFKQPLKWISRNVEIFGPLALFAFQLLLDIVTNEELARRKERAKQLLDIISAQSPALIKAAQALASRPDLLPKEYLDTLQQLQDRCPAYPTEQAMALFREEFKQEMDDVFTLDSPTPIAAASIGQVYKATLRNNGAKVAIKIQRPNCEEAIAIDLFVLRWYSQVFQYALSKLGRSIDLVSVIDDFGDLIYREIDYRAEAVNAQRFAELYADIPDLFVPKIYPLYSTSKVLTMEWVDGCRLTNEAGLRTMGIKSPQLVNTLVECSLRQMLDNGFFHADPHAGNLLALPSGKLCYLDFGMVSYVEPSQRYSIIEAVVHLVNRDFESLTNLYRRMGFIPEDVDVAPIVNALADALPDVLNAPVGQLNFKNVISRLGDVMFKFPFSLPPFYIALIRCLGVLEGVAIEVDKDFRIINRAYPYIASRLLSDPSSELQAAAKQLLLRDGIPRWERLDDLLTVTSGSDEYDILGALDLVYSYIVDPQNRILRESIVTQTVTLVDAVAEASLKPKFVQSTLSYVAQNAIGTARSLRPSLGGSSGNNNNNNDNKSILGAITKQGLVATSDLIESNIRTAASNGGSIVRDDHAAKVASKILRIMASKKDLDYGRLTSTLNKMSKDPTVKQMIKEIVDDESTKTAKRLSNLVRNPLALISRS